MTLEFSPSKNELFVRHIPLVLIVRVIETINGQLTVNGDRISSLIVEEESPAESTGCRLARETYT